MKEGYVMKHLRTIALLVICALALSLFACTIGGGSGDPSGGGKNNGAASFTFEGETVTLTYEANHRDLFYKENLTAMHRDTMGSVRAIDYDNGGAMFQILMVYYENKSLEEVLAASGATLTDKTVNGLTYKYFDFDRDDVPGHTYVYEFEGTTYTISFISDRDTASLEAGFMGAVRFEKAG